ATVVILIIAVALVLHINSLNNDGDSPRSTAAGSRTRPTASEPDARFEAAPSQPAATTQGRPSAKAELASSHAAAKGKNVKKKPAAPAAPIVVPGQMAIDSVPQGAQVEVDGKTDPSWVTPVTL